MCFFFMELKTNPDGLVSPWMNFRHGVGVQIVHRNLNMWIFFPMFHVSRFRSKFLHYFHHEQEHQRVQDCHRFFCDPLEKFQIEFLRLRMEIICVSIRMKSNPIFQRRQLRLLVLFLAVAWIQHAGSIFKFSRKRKWLCQKMQINSRTIFTRRIFVLNEWNPKFELYRQSKRRKSTHKWSICHIVGSSFEWFFLFRSIWRFLFWLRF